MTEVSYTINLKKPRTGKEISEAVKELAEEIGISFFQRLYSFHDGKRRYDVGFVDTKVWGEVSIYGDSGVVALDDAYQRVNVNASERSGKNIPAEEVEQVIQKMGEYKENLERRLG